jgi:TRAP-type uncharacterized transport system fused permease subunit
MLQDGGPLAEAYGYVPAVAYILAKTVVAIALWGAAVIGFLACPLSWAQRALALVAAFSLVAALPLTDGLGLALTLAFAGWNWLSFRAARQAASAE